VSGALDDKWHRQCYGNGPRRHDQRDHVTCFLCTAHPQRVHDADVAVQRDRAQVHYGRRRQDDVTSGPRYAYVETEVPTACHLQHHKAIVDGRRRPRNP